MENSRLKFYTVILSILVAILLVSLFFLYRPQSLYRPLRHFLLTHSYKTLGAHDINTVRPWMTFDYLDSAFRLPKEYLKNTLNISDARYPNLSLGDYARESKMSAGAGLAKVKAAMESYYANK